MDAFYAAIEQRDQPALRGQPVIVGRPPTQRGVVCAASYEARKFGVRSAMPSATAGRLCPRGIFVPPRMACYREESCQVTVEEPVSEAAEIYRLGCFLLGRQKLVSRPLRLLGLGVSHLGEPAVRQLRLRL